jgi:tight adherence protein B
MMNILIPVAVLFIISIAVLELSFAAVRTLRHPDRGKVRRRLKELSSGEYENGPVDIMRKRVLSNVPFLHTILSHTPGVQRLGLLLRQANSQMLAGSFIGVSSCLGLVGYLGMHFLMNNRFLPFGGAVFLGLIPLVLILFRKTNRMKKFERQLPDALELISRSLRAGHAFSGGLKLAADEFEDPIGTELEQSVQEINFGVSVHDALKNLAHRIDCPDLKYFVVSVILQRETGGNLAEIIDSIAYIVRERFKLRGKIKVLSAEARFSAIVLAALPFLIVLAIRFTNPKYLNLLFTDTLGKVMVGIALGMMVFGILVMKKMVNIKV